MERGRIRGTYAEALRHFLNEAKINLAFWAAEGPADEVRRACAQKTLAAVFDGLTIG